MHISPINKNQENNTNFKKLKMNHYTHDYVKTISEKDRKLIQSWKKELANTKYFDILVSCDYKHHLTTFLYKKEQQRKQNHPLFLTEQNHNFFIL